MSAMRPWGPFALLVACGLGGAASLGAQAPATPAVTCAIGQPEAGAVAAGDVGRQAVLGNLPDQRLKARVECCGMVHHFVLEPPWWAPPGRPPTVRLADPYLPCRPGTHTLHLVVFAVAAPEPPLVDRSVEFTIGPPAAVDPQQIEFPRSTDLHSLRKLRAPERLFAVLQQRAPTDGAAQEPLRHLADELQKARVDHLVGRLDGLAALAGVYTQALDRRRALGCLQTAANLFTRESPGLSRHPLGGEVAWQSCYDRNSAPLFLVALGDFHARYAHLDEAVSWRRREIEFLQACLEQARAPKQRRDLLFALAAAHQRLGDAHVLLVDDMEAWQEWHEKAEHLREQARDG